MIDRDQIVNDIRAAAEEVFSTMLGAELRFTESYSDKGPSHPLDGVVCLIGMAGEWTGTGSISCSAEFACRIASLMLMAEYGVVDDDVLDAVAEVANMVLGNVKTALEKTLLAKSFGDETWSVVVFDCEGQRLEVKLFLKRAPAPLTASLGKACTPVYLRG
jgi:chemotaxis protein CheX